MKQAALRILAVAAAAVGIAASLAAPALLFNWYENTLESGTQLVPFAWDLRAALTYLPIGAAGIVGAWLFTRGRTVLASPSPVRHWAKLLLLLAWTFLAASAAMTAAVFTSDDFIFPTTQPRTSARSPKGARTAHVIYDCFFGCTLSYAIEEKGAWSMKRIPVTNSFGSLFAPRPPAGETKRDATPPNVEWINDDKFRFVGGDEAFKSLQGQEFPEGPSAHAAPE